MSVLPLSEVKARLSEVAEEVHRTHERVTVTRNGHDYVVLLSVDDLVSIEETLELLSDSAELQEVLTALQDVQAGNFATESAIDELIAKRLRESSQD